MESKILDFKNALKERDKCEKEWKDAKKDKYSNITSWGTHLQFCLYTEEYGPGLFNTHKKRIFSLDEEDINYLKKKYLSKLEAELLASIAKLKYEYKEE